MKEGLYRMKDSSLCDNGEKGRCMPPLMASWEVAVQTMEVENSKAPLSHLRQWKAIVECHEPKMPWKSYSYYGTKT
jgi:hypothetical protein